MYRLHGITKLFRRLFNINRFQLAHSLSIYLYALNLRMRDVVHFENVINFNLMLGSDWKNDL